MKKNYYKINKYSLGIILSILTAVFGFVSRSIPFQYNELELTLNQASSICNVPLINLAPLCKTVMWINYFSWFMVIIGLMAFVYFNTKKME